MININQLQIILKLQFYLHKYFRVVRCRRGPGTPGDGAKLLLSIEKRIVLILMMIEHW